MKAKLKKKTAFLLAVVIMFTTAFVLPDFSYRAFAEDISDEELLDNQENENSQNTSEEITEECMNQNDDLSIDDTSLLGSGDYGNELNRQGIEIGIDSYLNGTKNSSFNEGILRYQWDSVYCFDLSRRFRATDNYTHYTVRPESFTQTDQDVVALIIYYFHNIKTDLDDRPVVQYYYTQCCLWNYLHSSNASFFPYTAYIQYSDVQTGYTVTKTVDEQKQIFNECLEWVNDNKDNYTTSIEYWRNNDGDYQPVLKTNVYPKKGKIQIIKSSTNSNATNNNGNYSLQGAVYGVYNTRSDANSNSNRVTTITTGADGTGKSGDLSFATYYVKEITASKGFSLDENVYEATINSTIQTATVNSAESPMLGIIKVIKQSANSIITENNNCYSLEGAVYGVYNTRSDANSNSNCVTTITTDINGNGTSEVVPYGTYYIKEITASKGYSADENIYEAIINSTTPSKTVSSSEKPQDDPAIIVLTKRDSLNRKPIEGAIYEVKYYAAETDNQINNTTYRRHWYLKTKSNGEANLDDEWLVSYNGNSSDEFYLNAAGIPTFPLGYITIQEVEAPVEYVLDNTVYTYKVTDHMLRTIASNEPVEPFVNEQPVKQAFQIIKFSDDGSTQLNPLAGAGFMAWNIEDIETDASGNYIFNEDTAVPLAIDGSKEMFTDADGYALSAELRYGKYIIKETTVPDNHLPIDTFTVTISEDSRTPQSIRYFTDKKFKAFIKIIKLDEKTGNKILSDNAVFKIYDMDNDKYVTFNVWNGSGFDTINEFKTSNGVIVTPDALNAGKYRIEEVKSPYGYFGKSENGTIINITNTSTFETYIDEEGNVTDMGVFTVEIENTPETGELIINKVGVEDEKVDGTWEKVDKPLENVKFGLYAVEDILSTDGNNTAYKKGELITQITTGKDGIAKAENLPEGKYVIREMETPEGFIPADDVSFELTYSDDNVKVITNEDGSIDRIHSDTVKIKNYRIPPELHTTAMGIDGSKYIPAETDDIILYDYVDYNNLIIGKPYLLTGALMDKATGEPIYFNGEKVTAGKLFIPEKTSGTEIVEFKLTGVGDILKGKTTVVFENLYYEDLLVVIHASIEDEDQTVYFPEIHTTATSKNDGKTVEIGKDIAFNDKIDYKNFEPGKTYEFYGMIYDKTADCYLTNNGTEVTSSIRVNIDEKNSTVNVPFTIDTTEFANHELVVFEWVYEITVDDSGQKVKTLYTKHMDKDSKDQTIKVASPPKPPKTGDSIAAVIMLMITALGLMIGLILSKKLKKKVNIWHKSNK